MHVGEQSFGRFPDQHEIGLEGARIGERRWLAFIEFHRADTGIEAESEAKIDLRSDLGPVLFSDVRQAHRGKQNSIRAASGVDRGGGQRLARFRVMLRAGRQSLEFQLAANPFRDHIQNSLRRGHDFRPDTVSVEQGDAIDAVATHLEHIPQMEITYALMCTLSVICGVKATSKSAAQRSCIWT